MARVQGLPPTPLPGIPGEMKAGNAASFSSSKALRGGKQLLWLREMDIAPCTSQCEPGLAIHAWEKKYGKKDSSDVSAPKAFGRLLKMLGYYGRYTGLLTISHHTLGQDLLIRAWRTRETLCCTLHCIKVTQSGGRHQKTMKKKPVQVYPCGSRCSWCR